MTPHCHADDNTSLFWQGGTTEGQVKSWREKEEQSDEAQAQMFTLIVGPAWQTGAGVASADGPSHPRSAGRRHSAARQTARRGPAPPVFPPRLEDDPSPCLHLVPQLAANEESVCFRPGGEALMQVEVMRKPVRTCEHEASVAVRLR